MTAHVTDDELRERLNEQLAELRRAVEAGERLTEHLSDHEKAEAKAALEATPEDHWYWFLNAESHIYSEAYMSGRGPVLVTLLELALRNIGRTLYAAELEVWRAAAEWAGFAEASMGEYVRISRMHASGEKSTP